MQSPTGMPGYNPVPPLSDMSGINDNASSFPGVNPAMGSHVSSNDHNLILDNGMAALNGSMDINQTNNQAMGPPPGYDPNCLLFDFIIEAVLMGTLCLFGFTGNTLSMICLWRDKSKTATPFLLVSLEVADTLFLVTVLILRVMTSVHTFTGWLAGPMAYFPYFGTYLWPIALIAETTTIYLTLLVTVNRYISVCRPYEAVNLCSMYHARRHVLLVSVLCILYNMPRFFEYKVVHILNPHTNQTEIRSYPSAMGENFIYQVIYGNALYFLVMFMIPLVTLIILNHKLIKALRKTKKKRAQLLNTQSNHTHSKSEDDITLILIVVVLVFVICQTPALITQSLFSFLDQDSRICPKPFFFYERISDLMVVANSSMNFIIYCFCSRKFRQILVMLVCKKKLESPEPSQVTRTYKLPRPSKGDIISKPDAADSLV